MEWFRSVVLFTTAVSFIQWITPDGTMEKYIKYVISLLTLAVILSPLFEDRIVTTALELPVGAVAAEEGYVEAAREMTTFQTYQIREILSARITREVKDLLSDDFPDISETDIEVYIQQGSLEQETIAPCTITIRTTDLENSEPIRHLVSETLDLSGSCIRVVGKETADE